MRKLKAGELDAGVRADVFITAKYPQFSRSSLEGLFENDQVTLKKKTVKPSYKMRAGDTLTVDDSYITREPAVVDLPIIYEDDDVVVINKPAGMLTHSKGALNTESTVASFIKSKLHDGFPDTNRAGIVHRLDRGTSGLIITAKTPEALSWLQRQFSARKTKKIYLAVVEGVPEPAEAIIDAPIARNPRKPQTFYVNSVGKPAQTEYKILKKLNLDGKVYALLEVRPQTGRTHQIRLHMAYIGHPVVGDRTYGTDGPNLMLHAASLELTLPSRERKVFKAPEPASFKEFMDNAKPL
jgi:23S rRNA pseudouridine1911/1915/1917 synthase